VQYQGDTPVEYAPLSHANYGVLWILVDAV
jgi:hypothetical protein